MSVLCRVVIKFQELMVFCLVRRHLGLYPVDAVSTVG
jgi:hypothetical protein